MANKFPTKAQTNGKRYERQAIAYLGELCGIHNWQYKASPWICFRSNNIITYRQPDFLIFINSPSVPKLVICEIKIRHTREALPQMQDYKTVLQKMYPTYLLYCLEVCKYFDPAEGLLPLVDSVESVIEPISALVWRAN